jgi:hypothetical protein
VRLFIVAAQVHGKRNRDQAAVLGVIHQGSEVRPESRFNGGVDPAGWRSLTRRAGRPGCHESRKLVSASPK